MIEAIKKAVIQKLENHPERLNHVLGVYETSVLIAKHYQVDEHVVGIAALFHDYMKTDSIEDQKVLLSDDEIKLYEDYPVMYHALSAKAALKTEFGITDDRILSAIETHVWGKKAMNLYEQIVFVSDYAEPARTFFDSKMILDMALNDLDQATVYCMRLTLDYLKRENLKPSYEQLEAYEYYVEVTRD